MTTNLAEDSRVCAWKSEIEGIARDWQGSGGMFAGGGAAAPAFLNISSRIL